MAFYYYPEHTWESRPDAQGMVSNQTGDMTVKCALSFATWDGVAGNNPLLADGDHIRLATLKRGHSVVSLDVMCETDETDLSAYTGGFGLAAVGTKVDAAANTGTILLADVFGTFNIGAAQLPPVVDTMLQPVSVILSDVRGVNIDDLLVGTEFTTEQEFDLVYTVTATPNAAPKDAVFKISIVARVVDTPSIVDYTKTPF